MPGSRRRRIVLPALLAAAALALGAAGVAAEPAPGTAGQRIHVDPATGRPVPPPPGAVPPPAPPAAARRYSAQGLVEERSAAPGGGVMVRLNGRFRQEVRAHVQPDGTVRTECVPAEAGQ